MVLKRYIALILFSVNIAAFGQQNICADSSYRMKYTFTNEGAVLYINSDTSGNNYFTGSIGTSLGGASGSLAIMRTNWGDSIYWAKKIIMANCQSSKNYFAPDGTIVATGSFGLSLSNNLELLIYRFDTTGKMLWAKRYRLTNNHQYYNPGNFYVDNIIIANNAIYAIATFNYVYTVVAKLDLNGTLIWSKLFNCVGTGASGSRAPAYANNKFYFFGSTGFTASQVGNIIITSLNDADGSISESYSYKPLAADTLIKSILPDEIKINNDNSFSVIGLIGSQFAGTPNLTDILFNTKLDITLNQVHNFYYKNNIPLYNQEIYCDLNGLQQKAILTTNNFNLNEKYFMTFNEKEEVVRTRKFSIASIFGIPSGNSLKFDTKQNLHFLYQYFQSGRYENEYARISNFSPGGTVGCFGKDTSILTRYPFTLVRQPYTWSNVQTNVLTANDVPYTEQDATVTKQLICKIVSYCDTVKITGPAAACINQPVRYSVKRNATCQKFTDWSIDTAFANIVNMEGDSAITLSFKKPFTGYLHAALSDCVIKDSIFIKAVTPKMLPLINRTDSLLCPGKTLTLNTNNGYSNYMWQGSSSGQQFTITAAGKYVVTALDSCSNPVTDSIVVTLSDTSLTLPASQTICLYDTAFIALPSDVNNITWQPAANSLLRNKTIVAYPSTTTLYTVTAERQTNCAISRISLVTVKPCPQTFYMPNSFTPNNDGLNDKFKPTISQPLAAYHLTIYNRYGQNIFTTGNQNTGWDGMYQNSKQPMGGYIYYCTYRFNNGAEKTVKGYFMLLR